MATRPDDGPTVTVCVCAHNPRSALLADVIASIARQTADFGFLLLDSASKPPLSEAALQPLRDAGISARLVREERPGLTRARIRAIAETDTEWILFCDDDTVLMSDFVAEGKAFIAQRPEIGCFGGRLLLPPEIHCPGWARPFLPYLAIKDIGDEPLAGIADGWREWEPPGAGVFVARDVLEEFRRFVEHSPDSLSLGRSGANLSSCEDSLMARCAYALNKAAGYNPRLVLHHHIDPRRLRFSYLMRLLRGYAFSHVALERVLKGRIEQPAYYASLPSLLRVLLNTAVTERSKSWRYALAIMYYHVSSRRAYNEMSRTSE